MFGEVGVIAVKTPLTTVAESVEFKLTKFVIKKNPIGTDKIKNEKKIKYLDTHVFLCSVRTDSDLSQYVSYCIVWMTIYHRRHEPCR